MKVGRPSRMSKPSLSLRILGALILVAAMTKLLDSVFVQLNSRTIVLPQFDVTLIPTHDPRVSKRLASVLRYKHPPRITFTGDSRTKCGFDPAVIGCTLGVPAETFFNFGTGSQTVRFTREVFLPHLLLGNGIHTKYLVFGVSPDWLLTTPKSLRLINLYKESLHYRMTNPDPGEDDRIGTAISHFLARHLALYRYRSDLIHQELIPDLRCWLLGDCHVRPYIDAFMTFREAERAAGLQTRYGWHSDLWALLTSGEYKSHGGQARFTEENEVDRENLKGLIDGVRKAGITPVFLIMPVHPTFREVHEPAMSRNQAQLEALAQAKGVDVLYTQGDYSDAELFTDGHHLSPSGAAYFSADIAPRLRPYLQGGESPED